MCSATRDSEWMSRNHSCPCETNYGSGINPEVLTHYNWLYKRFSCTCIYILQTLHYRC
jgi:hypothetical protein